MIKNLKTLERVNYHLTFEQHNALKKLSDETSVSVAAHIRMAVDKYLKGKQSK